MLTCWRTHHYRVRPEASTAAPRQAHRSFANALLDLAAALVERRACRDEPAHRRRREPGGDHAELLHALQDVHVLPALDDLAVGDAHVGGAAELDLAVGARQALERAGVLAAHRPAHHDL